MRKKIKYVDMQKIEQAKEDLNDLEVEVRSNISHDPREAICNSLDLEEALKTLTNRQRECFELVIQDGYTEREAAKLLGISSVTVHEYVQCAKKKIRKILGVP